jgi:signal transduction histidine kinase
MANITKEYNRQKRMIIGEGIVFGIALISGILFLYAAYRKTLIYSQRQNNFLLSITHELKTPLASIKLAFETIKMRKLKAEQNAKISDNGILEVNRLHNQVENILTATSIDQEYEPLYQQTNLKELFDEIVESRRLRPHENRVNYSLDEHNDKDFNIDIYGCLLICENLLGNALKYSEGEVQFKLSLSKNQLHIVVEDEGIGIDDMERKNIFKRFYRIGNEETRKSKGTGLGLYIVKRIVETNNGSIKIMKNAPTGSIFNVEIGIK